MLKYLKVFRVFVANAFSYEAQYRADTWLRLFFNVLWMGTLILSVEIFFSQSTEIAGWSKGEVYLLTAFWMIVDELGVMLFSGNLPYLSQRINEGVLDLTLTRPIAPLFTESTRLFLIRAMYRLLMELIFLIWIIFKFAFSPGLGTIAITILLVCAAVIVNYSLSLFVNTLGFWFQRIDNVNDLLASLAFAGRYPIDIFPRYLKIITLTILPLAFSAYLPSAWLTGRLSLWWILYALAFSGLILCGAVKFWGFALRRYSSASS